ncbi:uncharacterized protein LOC128547789 [Mercenaria mercenaria]|uniref:uncharacterized protein LOC128547789 n=1 Tax=Mercenaria mercenaria TaxID=6596 RepID=UPI00234F7F2A|nr:uncharacterized protein LOC128547789 [Mercenaria mercenaria]
MTDNKLSSFPHVLKEYNPDYVPGTTPKSKTRQHECSQEKSLGSLQDTRSLEHNSHKRSDYISVASARSNARSVTTSGQKSAGKKSRKSDDQDLYYLKTLVELALPVYVKKEESLMVQQKKAYM